MKYAEKKTPTAILKKDGHATDDNFVSDSPSTKVKLVDSPPRCVLQISQIGVSCEMKKAVRFYEETLMTTFRGYLESLYDMKNKISNYNKPLQLYLEKLNVDLIKWLILIHETRLEKHSYINNFMVNADQKYSDYVVPFSKHQNEQDSCDEYWSHTPFCSVLMNLIAASNDSIRCYRFTSAIAYTRIAFIILRMSELNSAKYPDQTVLPVFRYLLTALACYACYSFYKFDHSVILNCGCYDEYKDINNKFETPLLEVYTDLFKFNNGKKNFDLFQLDTLIETSEEESNVFKDLKYKVHLPVPELVEVNSLGIHFDSDRFVHLALTYVPQMEKDLTLAWQMIFLKLYVIRRTMSELTLVERNNNKGIKKYIKECLNVLHMCYVHFPLKQHKKVLQFISYTNLQILAIYATIHPSNGERAELITKYPAYSVPNAHLSGYGAEISGHIYLLCNYDFMIRETVPSIDQIRNVEELQIKIADLIASTKFYESYLRANIEPTADSVTHWMMYLYCMNSTYLLQLKKFIERFYAVDHLKSSFEVINSFVEYMLENFLKWNHLVEFVVAFLIDSVRHYRPVTNNTDEPDKSVGEDSNFHQIHARIQRLLFIKAIIDVGKLTKFLSMDDVNDMNGALKIATDILINTENKLGGNTLFEKRSSETRTVGGVPVKKLSESSYKTFTSNLNRIVSSNNQIPWLDSILKQNKRLQKRNNETDQVCIGIYENGVSSLENAACNKIIGMDGKDMVNSKASKLSNLYADHEVLNQMLRTTAEEKVWQFFKGNNNETWVAKECVQPTNGTGNRGLINNEDSKHNEVKLMNSSEPIEYKARDVLVNDSDKVIERIFTADETMENMPQKKINDLGSNSNNITDRNKKTTCNTKYMSSTEELFNDFVNFRLESKNKVEKNLEIVDYLYPVKIMISQKVEDICNIEKLRTTIDEDHSLLCKKTPLNVVIENGSPTETTYKDIKDGMKSVLEHSLTYIKQLEGKRYSNRYGQYKFLKLKIENILIFVSNVKMLYNDTFEENREIINSFLKAFSKSIYHNGDYTYCTNK